MTETKPTIKQAGDPRGQDATWILMPAPPNVCSQCAVDHDPDIPHNQQSMFYHYAFYAEHGRWPNWYDAMAHCTPEVMMDWIDALRARGVEL